MGPIGMQELVLIVIVLIVLTVPVVIAIALAGFLSSRRKSRQPPQLPQAPKGNPERLAELDDLRSRNLITESEYQESRKRIIDEI
ncbi:MAG: hypothetical protein J0M04_14350 [Verrucomicrobia bacterium]|nr:hypothetical protein [Verrucomicrobiota bacterium]